MLQSGYYSPGSYSGGYIGSGVGGQAPFSPTSISGLQLWLDASDSSTIIQSGGNVSQWNDKSGNSYNASQSTGANQPAYITAGQNGLNLLRFTTTGQSLTINSALTSSSVYTAFVVWLSRNNTNSGLQAGFYIAPALLFNASGLGSYNWLAYRISGADDSQYSIYNNYHISAIAQSDTSDFNMYTDANSPTASSGASQYSSLTKSIIGTDEYNQTFIGDICEIIYYPKLLTGTQIAQVQAYLQAKWIASPPAFGTNFSNSANSSFIPLLFQF